MKMITQATEKRIKDMVKREHKFGGALEVMLDTMKAREGWLGASLKQMKVAGYELENETQIPVRRYYEPLMNGMAILFPDYFDCSFCLDLHYASIKDFNKLVKAVDEMDNDGWGTY